MQAYRPGTLLGFGPAIDDGFYYDFMLPEPVSEADLPQLEELMRAIIASDQPFEVEALPAEAALKRIEEEMKEPYKAEYAKELAERQGTDVITFYRNGPFMDMCEGPHVTSTAELPADAFHLHSIAGAYWRGDENRPMLTRIYAWAFPTKKELRSYQQAREEQLKRDHRKLGAQLDLFAMSEVVGLGLPHWLPHGAVIVEELEKLAKEWEFLEGYERVRTPVLTRGKLFQISGHLELFKDDMFPGMAGPDGDDGGDENAYFLRPMNCPHHHIVFASRPRSYRDLPLRLAEYGHTFRYERSGTLQGLVRVRAMCMNDAHIYLTEDQIQDEFVRVLNLHKRYYDLFGLKDYHMRLSRWDPNDPKAGSKYINDPAAWEFSELRVREALKEAGVPFVEQLGEAAFYGPKVDIQFKTVGLREFTVSTCQLDFGVPGRFQKAGIPMTYKDRAGKDVLPYVIHRAPLSTHERFIGFLIEHYAGAFPMWLSPVQARFLPVSERFVQYAEKICERLRADLIRAEVDKSEDTLGKKIRRGTIEKVPALLVVGDNEVASQTVTVRRYHSKEQRRLPVEEFVQMLKLEIAHRAHVKEWSDLEALKTK